MSKFAGSKAPTNVRHPIKTTGEETLTHEGGRAFIRDPKSELFLLAVTNMVGEKTFYESAEVRDGRFQNLIHHCAGDDPRWVAAFVPFLRHRMNMRSASVVMAAEYVRTRYLAASGWKDGPAPATVVDAALARPDEPAELLAYWLQTYGRPIPISLRKGVARAVRRLYTEKAALKYDGIKGQWRMGDVLQLVRPKPTAPWQADLFKYLLDRRYDTESPLEEMVLPTISRVKAWEAEGCPLPLPEGVTWERLSGTRKMDAEAWESVIPQMGYMALLRNLRNFDDAGVSDEVAKLVADKLSDPEEVARSRQFPIRFLSAWKATSSMCWAQPLEEALNHSVANVPELKGHTLVMVDLSGSMTDTLSERSTVQRWHAASLFGLALALRAEAADLVVFSSDWSYVSAKGAASILRMIEELNTWPGAGGGTNTFQALEGAHQPHHDRVVILTDEQAYPSYGHTSIPASTPIYTFNLAGYQGGHLPSGEKNRYTFGGLTDAGFTAIELLERGRNQDWPF